MNQSRRLRDSVSTEQARSGTRAIWREDGSAPRSGVSLKDHGWSGDRCADDTPSDAADELVDDNVEEPRTSAEFGRLALGVAVARRHWERARASSVYFWVATLAAVLVPIAAWKLEVGNATSLPWGVPLVVVLVAWTLRGYWLRNLHARWLRERARYRKYSRSKDAQKAFGRPSPFCEM